MELAISTILWSFFLTLILGVIILATAKYHAAWTHDGVEGVQKFHNTATPRVGGLAVFLGVLAGFFIQADGPMREDFLAMMVCAVLPFMAGLKEDLYKNVSVPVRLLAVVLATLALALWSGSTIHRVDVGFLDQWLGVPVLALAFTMFAVAGLTNAINIVDGFNGLASGISVVILLSLAAMDLMVGDTDLAEVSVLICFALLAFMVLNFPFGKIFLGDAGAYFIGFCLAWLALLLPERNPTISPWASLVACLYPVTEVLFSMVRRAMAKMSATQPDNMHLHTLIKTRVVRRFFGFLPAWARNAMVSPIVWVSNVVLGVLAVTYHGNTWALQVIAVGFVLWYALTYWVLSRMPVWDGVGRRVD
jgi:UDP-N-acetylmuramyl pentapeptide phosphotransferase/UDP-N-acetylglucosamine-1-phosphate transferase